MWHLDTDVVIALPHGDRNADQRLTARYPRVGISAIVFAEARFGALNSGRVAENERRLREMRELLVLAVFDERVGDTYAHLRLQLERKGRKTPAMDLLIAATAVAHEATLVTHNTKHFEHIDGLQLEDWLAEG
jgi:tRNA(fMet)-specific endonuclease VapC